ncbi:hypothetical protein [Streptomyces sp. NPDC056549]|uniref:hypothetical protein n=1 Tax=Streptomyces sp. NPDC056549 TaxID=3345864 RepID=UPI0036BB3932
MLDLLAGPTHAAGVLHSSVSTLQPAGALSLPAAIERTAPAVTVVPDEATHALAAVERERPEPPADLIRTSRTPSARVPPVRPAATPVAGPCVLCGQPAQLELDGFPQHVTAEERAAVVAAAGTPQAPAPGAGEAPAPVAPVAPPSPVAEPPVAPVAPAELAEPVAATGPVVPGAQAASPEPVAPHSAFGRHPA